MGCVEVRQKSQICALKINKYYIKKNRAQVQETVLEFHCLAEE